MHLTHSFEQVFPGEVLARYRFRETRNASAILRVTNEAAFNDIVAVLSAFQLRTTDLTTPGGQESDLAARLNEGFRSRGWREARVDTRTRLELILQPYAPARERQATVSESETLNEGYKVDNFKDRVALDVEWNAKDGNLDRDISAYRSLYESALIDIGVMVSRTQGDLRELGYRLGIEAGYSDDRAKKILGTTTTTNMDKLLPRLTRGDSGGCPFLGIFICADTHEDAAR